VIDPVDSTWSASATGSPSASPRAKFAR
jgi:hypothetical protein